jgi:hypothetical protein
MKKIYFLKKSHLSFARHHCKAYECGLLCSVIADTVHHSLFRFDVVCYVSMQFILFRHNLFCWTSILVLFDVRHHFVQHLSTFIHLILFVQPHPSINVHPLTSVLSQPHFEVSVRSPLTLPKMGLESPPGLPKTQSSITGVKTPHLEVFFIPLERSWNVNVQNSLTWVIWTSTAQVMVERKVGSQTGSLTPNH